MSDLDTLVRRRKPCSSPLALVEAINQVPKKKKRHKRPAKPTSTLGQHKQVGKSLIPPLLTLPGVAFHSWTNDRLPELLWACLVVSVLPRSDALNAFREIASIGLKYRGTSDNAGWMLYHSQFPSLPPEILTHVVTVVTRHPLGYAALRPLLLLDGLPGRDQWVRTLGASTQDGDSHTLSEAVAKTLDHQSQEATDVRWLGVLFKIGLGAMHFAGSLRERAEELVAYPDKGDMRSVRPSIRAAEMALSMGNPTKAPQTKNPWSEAFWKECLDKTHCLPGTLPRPIPREYDPAATIQTLEEVHKALFKHWFQTLETTAVDAKHDAAFGFGFYGLATLLEMLVGRNGYGIIGRTLLRILLECRITLAYLRSLGATFLWGKFRTFGTGQAKLAFLKLNELSENTPTFVNTTILEALSNEDFFQEFVPIELGHWCGLDLRRMADASATKDDYDRVYGWASTFVHGHWPAIRDSCMTHCFNPLHRLHRIPVVGHRLLEDAVPDAVRLANLILDDVSALYPDFVPRARLLPRAHDLEGSI